MIDTTTQEPLRVTIHPGADPYIKLPFLQLDQIRRLLDEHEVAYTVDELIVSVDDGPEIAIIDLGRKGDAAAVQALLDGAR